MITGLGVVSPLGNSPAVLWESLLSGTSGVAPINTFPTDYMPTKFAAEARFQRHDRGLRHAGEREEEGDSQRPEGHVPRVADGSRCRAASVGQRRDFRGTPALDPECVGVVFGSDYMLTLPDDFAAGIARCIDADGRFDFTRWPAEGMPQVTPLWLLRHPPNMPASHVAIYNDFRGPNNSITLREASANAAVGEAFRTIMRGSAEVMVAGATGTRIHPMKMVHSVTQEEVAANGVDPARASRPFDLHRSGMVLGEGAGAVVLEELAAETRGGENPWRDRGHVVQFGHRSSRDCQSFNSARERDDGVRCEVEMKPDDLGHLHARWPEHAQLRRRRNRGPWTPCLAGVRGNCRSRPRKATLAIWALAAA